MIEVRFDHQARCIFVRGVGAISRNDVESLVQELRSAEEGESFNALYDYSNVTSIDGLSADLVRDLATAETCPTKTLEQKKVAIVASADLLYGMSRMYALQSEAEMPGVAVFREIEAARIYLGLSIDKEA